MIRKELDGPTRKEFVGYLADNDSQLFRQNNYFVGGVDFDSLYFRIPFVEITNNGVVIAGADIRYVGGADDQKIDIGIARSLNYGKEWQDKQIVHLSNNIVTNSRKSDGTILVNRNTNRVFIFCHVVDSLTSWQSANLKTDGDFDFIYKYSDDDGLTWSEEISLKSLFPANAVIMFGGVGKGITMANGTLVLPVQMKPENGTPHWMQANIIYSTDDGETWLLGGSFINQHSSECQVIEYETGKLMLNARTNDFDFRAVFTTENLGESWVAHTTNGNTLVEPGACQGCLDKLTIGTRQFALFSNPNNGSARKDITVKISEDYVNWTPIYLATPPGVAVDGYSCITNYEGKICLVLERKGKIEFHNLTGIIGGILTTIEKNENTVFKGRYTTALPSYDINNIRSLAGTYRLSSGYITDKSITNLPETTSGVLAVILYGESTDFVTQSYITSGYKYYIRHYYNGNWNAWKLVNDPGDVPTTQVIRTTKDLSTVGAAPTQTINTLTGRTIKGIKVTAFVSASNKICWGEWGVNGGDYSAYRDEVFNDFRDSSAFILLSQDSSVNRTQAVVANVVTGSFDLIWSIPAGTGATGVCTMNIMVFY